MKINFRLNIIFSLRVLYPIFILLLLISCSENKNNVSEIKFRSAWEKYSKRNFDEAIKELNQLIESDPKVAAPAYNLRGHCKLLGDYDLQGAIDDYDKAIELQRDFAYAYANRGKAYQLLKDYKTALKDFDMCIKYAPSYIEGYKERAYTKRQLEDFYGAIDDYNASLTIEPNNGEVLAYRGYLKYKLGDFTGACKDLTLAEKYGHPLFSDIRKKSCNK